jgi:hypothetical protein
MELVLNGECSEPPRRPPAIHVSRSHAQRMRRAGVDCSGRVRRGGPRRGVPSVVEPESADPMPSWLRVLWRRLHHTATRLRDQPQAPEAPRRRRPCAGSSCRRTSQCADAVRRELASLAPAFSNGPKVCGGIADPVGEYTLRPRESRRGDGTTYWGTWHADPTTTRLRVTRRTSRSSSWISRHVDHW